MEQLILPLLFVAVLASLASVVLQFVSWFMHNGLSNRVARLEAQQQNTLTHGETVRIYERLSSLETLVETQATTLETIKEHLLEND
ncbi:MAG: hypothetical protein FH747_13820 [Stenotrophomonas sp.]|uniref:hypothetical protein n=1 Tax=Stenotrophomonas sp. TaxID=69392 RepID=UPI00135426C8|nr:hypothetical protein [Stenotrophomonas sp.]MTI74712.1 hypothetical protein [Stenotrophomonas sp.]